MSDPNSTGLPCAYEVNKEGPPYWCGRKKGTTKDPRQDRYDVGLCPSHLRIVLDAARKAGEAEQ